MTREGEELVGLTLLLLLLGGGGLRDEKRCGETRGRETSSSSSSSAAAAGCVNKRNVAFNPPKVVLQCIYFTFFYLASEMACGLWSRGNFFMADLDAYEAGWPSSNTASEAAAQCSLGFYLCLSWVSCKKGNLLH